MTSVSHHQTSRARSWGPLPCCCPPPLPAFPLSCLLPPYSGVTPWREPECPARSLSSTCVSNPQQPGRAWTADRGASRHCPAPSTSCWACSGPLGCSAGESRGHAWPVPCWRSGWETGSCVRAVIAPSCRMSVPGWPGPHSTLTHFPSLAASPDPTGGSSCAKTLLRGLWHSRDETTARMFFLTPCSGSQVPRPELCTAVI